MYNSSNGKSTLSVLRNLRNLQSYTFTFLFIGITKLYKITSVGRKWLRLVMPNFLVEKQIQKNAVETITLIYFIHQDINKCINKLMHTWILEVTLIEEKVSLKFYMIRLVNHLIQDIHWRTRDAKCKIQVDNDLTFWRNIRSEIEFNDQKQAMHVSEKEVGINGLLTWWVFLLTKMQAQQVLE